MTEEEKNKIINIIENEYENEYLDFKLEVYDFNDNKKKADFLVDMMSLANSSYPGDRYIVMGVKDYPQRVFKSIEKSKVKDSATYQQLLNENIEPSIKFDVVNFSHNKYEFLIFKINFNTIDRPYIMKKDYGQLSKGDCRIRKGTQNANITRYDLDRIYESKSRVPKSDIKIKCIDENGKISDKLVFKKYKFKNSNEEIRKIVINCIEKANNYKIKDYKEEKNDFGILSLKSFFKPLEIEQKEVDIVNTFAKENNLKIDEEFFYIGDASISQITGIYNYAGSEQSVEKYKRIRDAIESVTLYYQSIRYRGNIEKLSYVELVVCNDGDSHDEAVSVGIHVPSDKIVINDFPIPEYELLNSQGLDTLRDMMKNKKVYGTNECTIAINYVPNIHKSEIPMPLGYAYESSYEDLKKEYYGEIENCIQSEAYEENNMLMLTHTQTLIKAGEILLFPSRLFFREEIDDIEYIINSKYGEKTLNGHIGI